MNDLQRMGGVAALIAAATFVVGFALLFTLLAPAGYFAADADPVQNAAFLADNQAIMYIWYLTIYVVFGAFLVVLALALFERSKAGSPAMAQTAAAFGLIWAGLVIASGMVANIGTGVVADLYGREPDQAASVWLALDVVVTGLGGGNEIVGGLWVLLVSWGALRAGGLPRVLNYFGVVIGVAGILTVVPALGALEVLGAVFGLGLIGWFAWLGIVMLRSNPSAAAYNRKGGKLT
ncbi:MAG: DUF4386 family protein [Actinomycetota bacterium]|nr:DUF4386 family protein [Actinomycetota bacterium]